MVGENLEEKKREKTQQPKSRQTEGTTGVAERPHSTPLGTTPTREGQTAHDDINHINLLLTFCRGLLLGMLCKRGMKQI
jgi:hypothetical protein